MSGKFDIQKIINDVKSMITPAPIPESNKDDPVGFYLSELNKTTKELAEGHTKQADAIAKINATLGELYQEINKTASKPKKAKSTDSAQKQKTDKPHSANKTDE